MIQFLAHRGLWSDPRDRNSCQVLHAAIKCGFGVETDIRDLAGRLVISHDPATDANSLATLLDDYRKQRSAAPLALNIKADGLRPALRMLLEEYSITNYFCFDMSIPETIAYQREGFRFFTRESEFEPAPALYDGASGVWLDMFRSDWVSPDTIRTHLANGKEVALVSPELHGRDHQAFWTILRSAGLTNVAGLMLCTDLPLAAREFFHA